MDYRRLGQSGLRVSPICLGTMMFAQRTERADAERIVAMARDAGVNFVDTADVYMQGGSESMLGPIIRADRDNWVLATKAVNQMGKGPNRSGAGRKWLIQAIDGSLSRLGTDHVDILYLHVDDRETPVDETVGTIGDLIRAGKIRYLGVSNFAAWRVAEICHAADRAGIQRPVASQPLYNAVNRGIEAEHLPACARFGLGVVPYSPLARGVLTGKYGAAGDAAADTRAAHKDTRMLETEWRPESFPIALKLAERARALGVSPSQWAVAWVLRNRLVTSVIAGPRTVEQWQDYLRALDVTLTDEDEALVDSLVAPGHASTHGYTDPRYPVTGRVTA